MNYASSMVGMSASESERPLGPWWIIYLELLVIEHESPVGGASGLKILLG